MFLQRETENAAFVRRDTLMAVALLNVSTMGNEDTIVRAAG